MKRVKVLILVLAFLSVFLLGTLAVCSAAEERVIITLPESVNVQGSELLLGTIAELSGPEELVSKVAAVNAGAAPIAGSSRRLTRGQIEVRLRQGGIDLKRIEFQGSTTVQVFGVAPEFAQAAAAKSDAGFPVYEVVVAAADLPRGHLLTLEDLRVETQEFRTGQPDLRTAAEFVGLRTKRHVLSGSPLTTLNVEAVPVIERGAAVTIVVETPSLVVSAPGIARGTGGLGEVIPVENTLSRQVVSGEIIDEHTVRVNLRGSGTP